VAIAEPPRCRARRIVANQAVPIAAPQVLERRRAVATEIPRIAPQLAILVEIVRSEDVDLERLDTFRHLPCTRGAEDPVLGTTRIVGAPAGRSDHVVLVQICKQRRPAPNAFETGVRNTLGIDPRAEQRYRSKRWRATCA